MKTALGENSETVRTFRDLAWYVGGWGPDVRDPEEQEAEFFSGQVRATVGLIEAAMYELELLDNPGGGDRVGTSPTTGGPIFVVHGRDEARQYQLTRLLDRAAEPEAIVLHEQINRGATILEKFERHAQAASFAIVLLTGDDEGRLRGVDGPFNPRGRQNVILELGVFIALLGRGRVVVLKDPDVEEPSDLSGLVYIPLDAAGAWRHKLLKELAAAGIKVYFDRIP